jgi:hypothetical protein
MRIFTFDVTSPDGFIDECRSLLARLPADGLVLDVRGNPGGNILAAEKLLQFFTPRPIQPAPMLFINTHWTLALCERHSVTAQPGLALGPWVESIRKSVQTGAAYSTGVTITPETDANEVGQQYYGPVLLITDPQCYSATDIFAAGFQDHTIGEILGVGANADLLLEDFGVVPDGPAYHMTRRDLLGNNEDLIAEAVRRLDLLSKSRPPRLLRVADVAVQGNQLSFAVAGMIHDGWTETAAEGVRFLTAWCRSARRTAAHLSPPRARCPFSRQTR